VKQWSLPVVVLFLAFIAAIGYLSYSTAVNYLRWRAAEDFRTRSADQANDKTTPEEYRQLLSDIRNAVDRLGGDDLKLLYMEQLVNHSWRFPDETVDCLRDAITIGQEQYRRQDLAGEYIIYRLSYAYLAAGLPTKLERWRAEALTQAPDSRPYLRYLEFWGRIMQDDLEGARQLVENELATRRNVDAIRGLALVCYSALDEIEAAKQFEDALEQDDPSDYYFTRSFADYLMKQGDFQGAQEQLLNVLSGDTEDPDYALYLAVAYAGELGLDDPKVIALLETSAMTTRVQITIQGANAGAASWLYDYTGDTQWLERLQDIAANNTDDFYVMLSLAVSAMDNAQKLAEKHTLSPASSGDQGSTGHQLLSRHPCEYTSDALALAKFNEELQAAHLDMARALLYPYKSTACPPERVDASLRNLRIALGDPAETDAVITQRVPDYEYFLQDSYVMQMRRDNPHFDSAVHRAIIDYLNRRRELFADIITLPELTYDD
jgi:hypothetical protein